jgi:hypothetical protein
MFSDNFYDRSKRKESLDLKYKAAIGYYSPAVWA